MQKEIAGLGYGFLFHVAVSGKVDNHLVARVAFLQEPVEGHQTSSRSRLLVEQHLQIQAIHTSACGRAQPWDTWQGLFTDSEPCKGETMEGLGNQVASRAVVSPLWGFGK